MESKLPFLACLGSTLYMTGLIWFVHVVHYPLFSRVGWENFRARTNHAFGVGSAGFSEGAACAVPSVHAASLSGHS